MATDEARRKKYPAAKNGMKVIYAVDEEKMVDPSKLDEESDDDEEEEEAQSWTPEQRAEFLAQLLKDDDGEEPLLAATVEDMNPVLVDALVQLRDGDEKCSVLAYDAKERGNKHFRTALKTGKDMWYRNAAREYADAVALCEGSKDDDEDEWPAALEATIKSNRAACSLALKNYGAAKRDAREALEVDHGNAKALYRLAKACFELKQWDAAITAATLGSAENDAKPFQDLLRKAKKREREEREAREKRKAANYKLFNDLHALKVKFTRFVSSERPHYMEEDKELHFPVVIEYPECDIPYDLVKDPSPYDRVADWLLTVFERPPFIAFGGADPVRYRHDNVAVYVRIPDKLPSYFPDADAYDRDCEKRRGTPLNKSTRQAEGRSYGADNDSDLDSDDEDALFLDVHPTVRLLTVLTHDRFVLNGPLRLQVRPHASNPHAAWKRSCKPRLIKVTDSR